MSQSYRITVKQVLAAYKATGLKPVFDEWGDRVTCGCPLTALDVVSNGPGKKDSANARPMDHLPQAYRNGFLTGVNRGVDTVTISSGILSYATARKQYEHGISDGVAVYDAVFKRRMA